MEKEIHGREKLYRMILYLIMIMNTLLMTVVSGIKPVLTLYASSIGVSAAQISIIVAAFPFLPVFLSVLAGKWVDRYGMRNMLILGSVGFLGALLLTVFFPVFGVLVLQQALLGVAFSFYMLSLQKRVGSLKGDVERAIANFSMTGSLGGMIGPVVSSWIYEHYDFQVMLAANICIIGIVLLMVLGIKRTVWDSSPSDTTGKRKQVSEEQSPPHTEKTSVWHMMRNRKLRNAILISGLVLSNRELFSAYFPLLGSQMGLSPTQIGAILSVSALASLVVRLSQSALVHTFGRMNVLMWSLYISGVVYLLIPFTPWLVLLGVLVGVLGAGLGLGQPLSLSYTIQVSPADRRGEVLGLRITVNRTAQFAIPVLFGGIGGLVGVTAIFAATGAVLMLVGYLTRPLPAERYETDREDA